MLKRTNQAEKSQSRSVRDDAMVDEVLETLASSARPDPMRSKRGGDPAVDEILETLAGSARPDLARLRRGVERRLVSGFDNTRSTARWVPRKRFWASALATVCLLALVLTWAMRDSRAPALVLLALGDATVTEDGRSQGISQSEPLTLQSIIKTQEDGMLTLLLSDLSCVRVAQSTCLRLQGRRDLSLEYGSLFAEVPPLDSAASSFQVRAGEVLVTVWGTSFEVTRSGGVVEVAVEKGTVRVDAGGSSDFVNGGQAARFDNGKLGSRWQTEPAPIAAWRQPLLAAEADDPTFVRLMRKHYPSRSFDLPNM